MEQHNSSSPSFINVAVLLLFAIVIAVASTVTTYFFLSSRSEEQPAITQPPIVPPAQTNVYPITPQTTQTTVPTYETANWKVYRNKKKEYGFEIKYPNNWNVKEYANPSDRLATSIRFGNPPTPEGIYDENTTNVVTIDIGKEYWETIELGIDEWGRLDESGKLRNPLAVSQSKAITVIDNEPAIRAQRVFKDGSKIMMMTVVPQNKNNFFYEISFNYKDSKNEAFFDKMLSTFKFLE